MVAKSTPPNDDDGAPWSPPSPSVATRRPGARSRYAARVTVISPDRREILCESDTESKAAYCLLAHPTVIGLREQPAAERYVDKDGVPHLHTFFIAIHHDKTRTAVMVRPEGSAERHELGALVDTFAKQASQRVADRFMLLTERDLDRDRVHDAKLTNAVRLHPQPDHDDVILDCARRANGPITVAALMALAELGGAGFRAIARLIGSGALARTDGGRLTHASTVAIAADVEGACR